MALLIVSFLCLVFLLTAYRRRISLIYKRQIHDQENDVPQNEATPLPTLSVVVYSKDGSAGMSQLLLQILGQEYPAGFEVIVVNDGNSEITRNLVEKLELNHKNIYFTFAPDKSKNLSRKKLSITIGIKAAHNDIVVITDSTVDIPSNQWLKKIARHFMNPATEIVIGYASPVICSKPSGKRRMAFDIAADAVTYLSAAVSKRPYRGNGYNLAYRREIFFNNKGFARSLNLHYGDDDIFINDISNRQNTEAELSLDAIPTYPLVNPKSSYQERKLRYGFTAKYIRKGSRRFFGFCSLTVWLWFLSSLATILLSIPDMFAVAVTIVLALALWIPLIMTWRKAMRALKSQKLLLTIPCFVLTRPIYNFAYKIKGILEREQNFTWH